ncbi:MAG: TolC family protein [Burkholderiales bacterium]|nr:TolC family protein [Burkholderiales bacterium]
MRKRLAGLLAGMLVGIAPAHAEIDLVGAARKALQHDPLYAAALAQDRADQAKRRQGRAGYLPQIFATGNLRYGTVDQETTGAKFSGGGFGSSSGIAFDTRAAGATGAGWAVTIKENLYSTEKRVDNQVMNIAADIGDASLRLARQTLLLRVAQAYFDTLLAEDTVNALRSTRDAALLARKMALARFETGDAAVTDSNDAQAHADLAAAQWQAAQTDLVLKRAALSDLTGDADTTLRPLRDSTSLATLPSGDFADWQQRAMVENPLLELRTLGVRRAEEESKRHGRGSGISVDAFASYLGDRINGAGYGSNSSMRSNSAVVGVMVTIPLYTGGLRSAQYDESVALLDKAHLDEDAARITVARDVREAYLGFQSAEAQVVALTQAKHSARLQLDANRTGFEAGDRPLIDVLNAQQVLFSTQRDLASARYQIALNRLRLAAAAGELDEDHMAQVNALLNSR